MLLIRLKKIFSRAAGSFPQLVLQRDEQLGELNQSSAVWLLASITISGLANGIQRSTDIRVIEPRSRSEAAGNEVKISGVLIGTCHELNITKLG